MLLYAVSATYILTCAVLLSVTSEKARANAQEPGQGNRRTHHLAQIDQMLRDIEGLRQGAFAHWTQQPVFRALLLPSGGLSLLALLDYFLTH